MGKKGRVAKKPAAADEQVAQATTMTTIAKKPAAASKKTGKDKALDAMAKEEAAVAARKTELKGMGAADLKDLSKALCLETGIKTEMVDKILAHEAKGREAKRVEEAKRREVIKAKSEEFASKGSLELKELCEKKGLKVGGGKDDRVERLVNHAKDSGEIDATIASLARDVRRAELAALDNAKLKQICDKFGVDPLVKEIMVDRIVVAEATTK